MASQGMSRYQKLALVMGLSASFLSYCIFRPWNTTESFFLGAPFGRDFVNFWVAGRLAGEERLDVLIDLPTYNALISQIFAHPPDLFVFSYPPSILPFLAWLADVPYGAGLVAWTVLNLACMVAATRLYSSDQRLALLACLSPAMLMTIMFGHFGGVAALCLATMLRCGRTHPWRSGALMALLSVKPQLFVLFCGLGLLVGQWSTVWRATLASGLLIAASAALYGLQPWLNFFAWTAPYHANILRSLRLSELHTAISGYVVARKLGLESGAVAVQAVGSLAFAGAVARVWRQPMTPQCRDSLFLLGGLAIMPYFNHYDMALAAPALTVMVFGDEQPARGGNWRRNGGLLLWISPAMVTLPAMETWHLGSLQALAGLILLVASLWPQRTAEAQA